MNKRKLTSFGVIVKKRLVELNKTQVELAKEIGTSANYLHLILYGERSGKKYMSKIMSTLSIDPNTIRDTGEITTCNSLKKNGGEDCVKKKAIN